MMKDYMAVYMSESWKGISYFEKKIQAEGAGEAKRKFNEFARKPSQYKRTLVKLYELVDVTDC